MRVEQAIFTSARTTRLQGYQLTSCSPGIQADLAQSLNRWGPSHGSLMSGEIKASSINFHPVIDGWAALSRTVYGGPEYSKRGGLQLFTRSLLFRCDQLAGFRFHPVALARLALALGQLRFQPEPPRRLPVVTLPDRAVASSLRGAAANADRTLVDRLLGTVEHASAAVIGQSDPLDVLMALFDRLPDRRRLELSFTTGLKPSMYRPFRLHFLPSVDPALQRQLNSHGVSVLTAQDGSRSEQRVTEVKRTLASFIQKRPRNW